VIVPTDSDHLVGIAEDVSTPLHTNGVAMVFV
jgi:hypothetical protein